jgi:diguanylate cyclase (GGDEF)-like protein
MRTSFRSRILLLFVGLLVVTLASTTLAVLRATNSSVESLLNDELAIIDRVFGEFLRQDRQQLLERGEVLAADFAFKRAMATGETETMLSVLANHGQRIGADLIMLVSPSREILFSTHDVAELPGVVGSALDRERGVGAPAIVAGEPFQLVLIPVRAPDLIGWLALGRAMDAETLARVREITSVEVTLVYAAAGRAPARISTLSGQAFSAVSEEPVSVTAADRAQHIATELRETGWLTRQQALLSTPDVALIALLSASLQDAQEAYAPMRLQMVGIAVAALLAAALATLLVARWVTRPVDGLVRAARTISEGDYSQRIDLRAGREFDALAGTLNLMQDTVAEREARIQHQAQHDMLTQLPNRNYIYSLFNSQFSQAHASPRFALAVLDLHGLTRVKDLYGTEFSDEVLRHVAGRVTDSLRRGDMAARIGDVQILLFLSELEPGAIERVMAKLREQFSDPPQVQGVPVPLEFTLGLVFCPSHGTDFDDLVRRAQIALVSARRRGEDHGIYELGQDERHLRQIQVANRLPRAIEEAGFTLLYQPKYDLHARRVRDVEVLLRWTDSELGPVYPDEFIPIAEQTGIITRISEHVLGQTLAQVRHWRESGLDLRACVNLSGLDIMQARFAQRVLEQLADAGLPAQALALEITETAMLSDRAQASENLAPVNAAGIGLSIDDFGTGFSSLAQLRALPVSELKIDKSLVMHMDSERDDRQIVRSTIEMAHYLGLEVVAEGVETEPVLTLLSEMGCDAVQGYYLARPMPAAELAAWMRSPPPQVLALSDAAPLGSVRDE